MFRSTLLRGVFAGAFPLTLASVSAFAQEALPSIDIAADRNGAASGAAQAFDPRPNESGTSYTGPKVRSSSKTNIPILDTPRSVAVIPKQVLEDNAILNTQDAVKFVSGVQTGSAPYYDSYVIRGFSNASNTYRDGLKLASVPGTADTAFVDRVEILKGPSSMLYGRIAPGGLVNFVMKRPQEEAAYSIQTQFGSWGLSRTSVDLTGPLTQDKSITYRLIGVYDHADDFIDFRHRDNGNLFGQLSWKPTTQFEANIGLEYYNDSTTDRGYYGQMIPVPIFTPGVPLRAQPYYLPRNWTQNDPQMYSQFPDVFERVLLTADWSYRFDNQWKFTNRFLYQHTDEDQQYMLPRAYNLTTGLMNRRVSWSQVYRDTYSLNADITGEVETGPVKHNLLFGFDYFWHHQQYHGDNPPNAIVPEIPQLEVWAPNYGGVDWPIIAAQQAYAHMSRSNSKQENYGYYVQDDISYNDFIHFLIGGRYDVAFDAGSELGFSEGTAYFPLADGHYNPSWKGNRTERRISPNGGLLFKLTPEYSLYASYSESFNNSTALALSRDNTPFKPQEGQQYELGAKASLLGGKITASVAAFDLYMKNVLSSDPIDPRYSVATGKVRSRGVEFDVAGQVTDNISLIASYTHDDAIILKDNATGAAAILGRRWSGVPRNSGNLWAKYDTAPGQKEGWSVGAGVYINGERQGNNQNTWQLPGYVRFDAMGGYRTTVYGHAVEAQLNIVNIADAKYFESGSSSSAYYGQPRTFIGSIKVKY